MKSLQGVTSSKLIVAFCSVALVHCARDDRSERLQPTTPVEVEILAESVFSPTLALTGQVKPDSSVDILAPASGVLRYPGGATRWIEEGTTVTQGQLLAIQRSTELELAFDSARLDAERAGKELDRQERARAAGLVSDASLEGARFASRAAERQLVAAREGLERLRIFAPIGGQIRVARRYPAGTHVDRGSTLATVLSTDKLSVHVLAPDWYAEVVRPGDEARISVPGLAQPMIVGTVREIAPQAGPGGSTEFDLGVEAGGRLRPGQGVNVTMLLRNQPRALSVPVGAVLVEGASQFVFTAEKKGEETIAVKRFVTLGLASEERVQVLTGLKPGDYVVAKGGELLVDGAPISVAARPAERMGRS